MDKQELSGGRKGAIFKHGETVIRPLTQWSKSVHCFLDYLARNGFDAGPKVIEATDSSETLSYVVGDVYNYPLVGAIASDQALTSAAQLLRRFHDVRRFICFRKSCPESRVDVAKPNTRRGDSSRRLFALQRGIERKPSHRCV